MNVDVGALDLVAHTLQLALALVLLLAVVPKLRRPRSVRSMVERYELIPQFAARAGAVALIAVEALLGVMLLAGAARVLAAAATLTVFAVFTLGVLINLSRRNYIPCGCFGASSERISAKSVFRLGILLTGSGALLLALIGGADPPSIGSALHDLPLLAYELTALTSAAFLIVSCLWVLEGRAVSFVFRALVPGFAAHNTTTDTPVVMEAE